MFENRQKHFGLVENAQEILEFNFGNSRKNFSSYLNCEDHPHHEHYKDRW